ncbi:hypothetical protein SAMN04488056_105249 [Cohaesibacter marisflavi]|uniref:Rap1a immunity protein domain-containing protein n=1 Tax=Cohaesibacter marisflavi TaxID=655353 RepID=A0A1I5GXR3_9HYPH|nr:hypothetical protein [Cohaesibacter marisflavi]SFO40785.1 hypothetical protein SAMN04488056_105249 [Cohaesibacter marisflavi]
MRKSSLAQIAAITAIAFASSMPTYAASESVKTKEFLTYDYASQEYFIKLTINTATVIATQIRPDMAQCIASWYGDTPAETKKKDAEILATMKRLPETYPSAVLIAILQKHCGKFGK